MNPKRPSARRVVPPPQPAVISGCSASIIGALGQLSTLKVSDLDRLTPEAVQHLMAARQCLQRAVEHLQLIR